MGEIAAYIDVSRTSPHAEPTTGTGPASRHLRNGTESASSLS